MGCSSFTIAQIINTAIIWASTRETLSWGGCEQHRRRPACASAQYDQRLFNRFLESIICKLAACEISIFKLVSIAEETGLKHSLSDHKYSYNMGLDARNPVLGGGANNTGADQPAHLRSMISAFLIAFWKVSYVNLLHVKFQFSS